MFDQWADKLIERWARLMGGPLMQQHLPFLFDRVHQYWLLMRFHRPIGTLLLLWPTLWALWLAGEGRPRADVFLVFVLGVVLMRAAGCVINDYADRNLDGQVRRTRTRPLAEGRVSAREALILFAALVLIAFLLVLTQNYLTIQLSVVGLVLAASYPFMKRYTYLPQLYLGAAFGWAAPMAFAAQTGSIPVLAWLVLMATVLWATVYDTMYAMVDRVDDMRVGIKSTAILFGDLDRFMIGVLQAGLLFTLYLIGGRAGLGTAYLWSLAFAATLMVYHQWLIRHRDSDACFQAFVRNSDIGLVIFIGIVLDYTFSAGGTP
jgi:4-hydroxybenzoate polyprenyltransferase